MPWPAKQRTAIFLSIKRKKGEKAALRFMHQHGYGGKHSAQADAINREVARRTKRKGMRR